MSKNAEVYERVVTQVIEALESGAADPAAWSKPWRSLTQPIVSAAGRAYRGGNVVVLAVTAWAKGYETGVWGTYKQWQALGAQVRKGESATTVILWKPVTKRAKGADDADERFLLARTFSVFNIAQVDADEALIAKLTPKAPEVLDPKARIDKLDALIDGTGAAITFGGDSAHYSPGLDRIALPSFESFTSAIGFYATALHELGHWTGHESRLARDLANRFGSAGYAAEELVAELTAAFALSALGYVGDEPRADHAHYVASWIKLLKSDPQALFTAASAAQKAADFILAAGGDDESTLDLVPSVPLDIERDGVLVLA